jgi:hypothetical protein
MTAVAEIVVSADPAAWRRFGLPLGDDESVVVGSVRICIARDSRTTGIASWGLAGAAADLPASIDGLVTVGVQPPPPASAPVGDLAAVTIDHLVVWTHDLERTCDAVATATGAPLKRVREVGEMRQGFHRLGEVILEVVQHPGVTAGPATFWGFVLNVVDLDAVFAHHGPDVITPPKDAVQPGRRIASVKAEAGLGVPVALMTR